MTKAQKLTATERKLAAMLTENTGTHFLDSGGAYGRNWQRNQGRQFKAEPVTVLAPVADYIEDGTTYAPEVTHNVFGFLARCLDYDANMNRRYQAFARKRRSEESEIAIMGEFMDYLRERGHEIAGLYGEGEPFTVNTYNGEDLLSQTLQYLYFTCDREPFVLLQIHGGCDVRGGYTDAVAFADDDNGGTSIYDNAKATIVTADPDPATVSGDLFGKAAPGLWDRPFWSTDDAYHWYRDGACGHGAGAQLETYPISRDPENRGKGTHVYVDADGAAHCPDTGLKLEAI